MSLGGIGFDLLKVKSRQRRAVLVVLSTSVFVDLHECTLVSWGFRVYVWISTRRIEDRYPLEFCECTPDLLELGSSTKPITMVDPYFEYKIAQTLRLVNGNGTRLI